MFEFLNKSYPSHQENRMENEGNIELARKNFLQQRSNNLEFLLKKRYSWMNDYLLDKELIYELGSGPGFSRFYLSKKIILTDIQENEWIDEKQDALNLNIPDNTVDVFICSHMIHHLAFPISFFRDVHSKLKDGGLILIQDIESSLLMRFILHSMRHEGFDENINVFDEKIPANRIDDPWSANCSIPKLLFSQGETFEERTNFKILKNEVNECFLFPVSGGVIAKKNVIELPFSILKLIDLFDQYLVRSFPKIFAMGRSIVLQKN